MKTNYSIFYLEDIQNQLALVTNNLPLFGPWRVSGSQDESVALGTFARKAFDLYLIDEWISDHYPANKMAGTEVFDKLKRMPTYKKTSPVIIYSQLITKDILKKYGHGSAVWKRTHDYYEMRRLNSDLQQISDSLLQIILQHRP